MKFLFKTTEKKKLKALIRKNGITLSYIKDGAPFYVHSNECSDESELSFALKQSLQQVDDVHKFEIELILSHSFYEIHQIDKPKVPVSELQDTIPWSIKDMTPIQIDNMLFDYCDILTKSSDPKINVTVADVNFVRQFVDICNEVKTQVTSINTEEHSIAQIVPDFESALFITCNSVDDLLITISLYGDSVLSRRVQGVTAICEDVELLIDQLIESISLEVQRSVDFFSSQISDAAITKAYIAVNGKNNARLANEITEITGLKTMPLLPEQRLGDLAPCASIQREVKNAKET